MEPSESDLQLAILTHLDSLIERNAVLIGFAYRAVATNDEPAGVIKALAVQQVLIDKHTILSAEREKFASLVAGIR